MKTESTRDELVITRERDGQVVVFRFNRPYDQNRSDYRMKEMLADAYEELQLDEKARVLILTGTGDYYATGGRVNASDEEERIRFEIAHERVLRAQQAVSIPVVLAINGDILGGAVGDMLTADYAVAVQGIKFGFPQSTRGSFPISSLAIAMDYLPQKFALEAFYTGKTYPIEKAEQLGLLNKVVPKQMLWEEVNAFIDVILSRKKEIISIGRKAYFTIRTAAELDRGSIANQFVTLLLQEEAKQKMLANKKEESL